MHLSSMDEALDSIHITTTKPSKTKQIKQKQKKKEIWVISLYTPFLQESKGNLSK
jgi:hypothetical protein